MERNILVVDDEPNIREMLKEALELSGYRVFTVSTSDETFSILKEKKIQVMFFDLNLGTKSTLNGMNLCREIRKKYPVACIYAITGYVSTFSLAECREAGFDDYFTKPIDLELLFRTAEESFEKLARWHTKKSDAKSI